jgi:ADP-heptose:LPS heptosyltransferase
MNQLIHSPKNPDLGQARERVVIYRLGSLGDTIVALPCFHAVARMFPDAERIVLTNFAVTSVAAPLEAVLGHGGLVSRYIAYPVGARALHELRTLRSRLLALGADTLVYLAANRGLVPTWRDLAFFKLCGFSRIIGLSPARDLRENRIDPHTGIVEPECERLARTLAGTVRIDLTDAGAWDLMLDSDERAAGAGFAARFEGRPFIAIHSGGKVIEKAWGEANWRALLKELAASHGDHGLLLLGAGEDAARYAAVTAAWPGRVVDGCGALTIRQCAAVLHHARLFIGHDSGPLHLASISGVRCVGLFGSYNAPRKWHPYVGTHRIIHRVAGISTIAVREVAAAARALLDDAARTAGGARPIAMPERRNEARAAAPAGWPS